MDDALQSARDTRGQADELQRAIVDALQFRIGADAEHAGTGDWTRALSTSVRDRLAKRWIATAQCHRERDVKYACYLSLEFLPGRVLGSALLALGLYETALRAAENLGLDLDTLQANEPDPALGNGGLGRLAACLMDSLATQDRPGFAYGIRYDYGMFAQRIHEGRQVETPNDWLAAGNPWEFVRPELAYPVAFGGHVEHTEQGPRWVAAEHMHAMAYDTLIPGYATDTVLTLRLWSARADEAFNLALFNQGHHDAAVADQDRAGHICRVLYPDDSTDAGRELRLRQEYFFVGASLQDIIRRYQTSQGSPADNGDRSLSGLADKAAVHLNDTHPAIAVAELMRLLVDEHDLTWDAAWQICSRAFSYTNHTLMPEALETWPFELVGALLPRHLEIILAINDQFLADVRERFPDDADLMRRVSLIDENGGRRVRMAHLAVVGSHTVNGVSALHSRLLVDNVFADFARIFPDRFINVTNGMTPRRWLNQANPGLAALLDKHIDPNWRRELAGLSAIAPLARDGAFAAEFAAVKQVNKQRLVAHIFDATGIDVDPDSLFDVQIKRIHEYKRQLLNVLHVIARYARIRAAPDDDWVPRTVIFAGKAASSYAQAKLIIKLIHDVAAAVNADPQIGARLKVVFLPNYSVREAERIVPAADLSEQISTAGTEASGTGNMKLAANGALTIGTEDGANIEIRDQVGADNIFIFGHDAAQIAALRTGEDPPSDWLDTDPELQNVLEQIADGTFSPDEPDRFKSLVDSLLHHGDHYKLLADFRAYVDAQDAVDVLYRDREEWNARAIANVAGMGVFSSDRMAARYADTVWQVERVDPAIHSIPEESS